MGNDNSMARRNQVSDILCSNMAVIDLIGDIPFLIFPGDGISPKSNNNFHFLAPQSLGMATLFACLRRTGKQK